VPEKLAVVLATPAGIDPTALSAAVATLHPDADQRNVCADDRASLPAETTGIGWDRLFLALEPRQFALAAGVAEAQQLLSGAYESVLVLLTGSAIVTAPLTSLLTSDGDLTFPSRVRHLPPQDNLSPAAGELLVEGRYSPIAFHAKSSSSKSLAALSRLLCGGASLPAGRVIEILGIDNDVTSSDAPDLAVGAWKAPRGPIALIDGEGHDPKRPWLLVGSATRPRVRLSQNDDLRELLWNHADQLGGTPTEPTMPDGMLVGPIIRHLARENITSSFSGQPLFADPTTDPIAFTEWLNAPDGLLGRFWKAVYESRSDLQSTFPEVRIGALENFRIWMLDRMDIEYQSLFVRPFQSRGYGLVASTFETGGVNVIGYLDRTSGIGIEAVRIASALEMAGLPVSRVAIGDSLSPVVDTPIELDQELRYDTNVIVVTAEQLSRLPGQLGQDPFTGRRSIGYWFWELSTPSDAAAKAIALLDQVWTPTEFVRNSFAKLDSIKVKLAPPAKPIFAPRTRFNRTDLGLPNGRVIFLCSLDVYSVVERKNPFGVIDAFKAAFEPNEGPLLLVKTLNGDKRRDCLERILIACSDRPDIEVRDGHLGSDEQLSLIAEADVLVSLHRSEGYGMHLAEAMAAGTTIIATNYSGPVDFLDSSCAELIPYRLVPVEELEGAYGTGEWAEPDLGAAASAMRRLYDNPTLRAQLVMSAHQHLDEMPSMFDTGVQMRSFLDQLPALSSDEQRDS
jgi:glycosyltransferase involved in cell wall biosynthesis